LRGNGDEEEECDDDDESVWSNEHILRDDRSLDDMI
jgi:hypothetical protein